MTIITNVMIDCMETHLESVYGSPGDQPESLSWSQDRRFKFIDFRLRWEGRVNRSDLVEFFNISLPQASLDLAKYTEAAPDNLKYDPKTKAYIRTEYFHPIYQRSASKTYLNELLALDAGTMEAASCFVRWSPPMATVPTPGREVDGTVLMHLLNAIREGRMINVQYQTMGREEATHRILSPHAIAHDGQRWHVRAYCHTRSKFRDFVIARLSAVQVGGQSAVPVAEDQEWHTILTLVLVPHPALPHASRRALEIDYGMTDGRLEVKCRHAMLLYTLIRLGLMYERSLPAAQQIVLFNEEEIEPYLQMLGASFEGQQGRLFRENV